MTVDFEIGADILVPANVVPGTPSPELPEQGLAGKAAFASSETSFELHLRLEPAVEGFCGGGYDPPPQPLRRVRATCPRLV